MNRKDLDALNELYLSVYDGEQLLNEAPLTPEQIKFRNERAQLGVIRQGGKFVTTGKTATDLSSPGEYMAAVLTGGNPRQRQQQRANALASRLNSQEREARISKAQDATIAAADKAEKLAAQRKQQSNGSSSSGNGGGGGGTPPRPAASSTVLAKQKGVEGRLDKATGKFTTGAFSSAEKSRYASVAAKNTASSAIPKPATEKSPQGYSVGTTAGGTKFERRTPTRQEMDAAKRAGGGEAGVKAAVASNQPTTGPVNATIDKSSVEASKAAFKPAPPKPPTPGSGALGNAVATATAKPLDSNFKPSTSINNTNPQKKEIVKSSYEWPSAKTIRDIAGAYSSIYEAKKKVDQDQDGDNDFADVRVARMIASGVPKAKAIAMVKDKSYNEEVELWVNDLLEEGYDLSEYTWEDMFEIYEATAMTKRGYDETEIRNKIAKSTGGGKFADKATELENRPTFGNKSKQASREKLARTQRGDFRRTTSSDYGLRLGAHKSDDPTVKAKQKARGAQRSALTPREKKMLNREAYETYEFVASYLLENNFANTIEDANVIINNMSEGWFESIVEEKKPLPVSKMKKKESKLLDNEEGHLQALRTDVGSKERKARMKELQRFDNINSVRTSVAKRGGKQQHSMPEIGRFKPKDED
jgi:hypothetical protein